MGNEDSSEFNESTNVGSISNHGSQAVEEADDTASKLTAAGDESQVQSEQDNQESSSDAYEDHTEAFRNAAGTGVVPDPGGFSYGVRLVETNTARAEGISRGQEVCYTDTQGNRIFGGQYTRSDGTYFKTVTGETYSVQMDNGIYSLQPTGFGGQAFQAQRMSVVADSFGFTWNQASNPMSDSATATLSRAQLAATADFAVPSANTLNSTDAPHQNSEPAQAESSAESSHHIAEPAQSESSAESPHHIAEPAQAEGGAESSHHNLEATVTQNEPDAQHNIESTEQTESKIESQSSPEGAKDAAAFYAGFNSTDQSAHNELASFLTALPEEARKSLLTQISIIAAADAIETAQYVLANLKSAVQNIKNSADSTSAKEKEAVPNARVNSELATTSDWKNVIPGLDLADPQTRLFLNQALKEILIAKSAGREQSDQNLHGILSRLDQGKAEKLVSFLMPEGKNELSDRAVISLVSALGNNDTQIIEQQNDETAEETVTAEQDTNVQDVKVQDAEVQDAKVQDTKVQDTEVQDGKAQDIKAPPRSAIDEDTYRRRYIVREGDTLESIASTQTHDLKLAQLIYEVNKEVIPVKSENGVDVVFLRPRLAIWLPSNVEIREFRKRISAAPVKFTSTNSAPPVPSVGRDARRELPAKMVAPSTPQPAPGEPVSYIVRLGDTLKSIAIKHPLLEDLSLWKLIAQANGMSTDIDDKGTPLAVLSRGSTLTIPSPQSIKEYRNRQAQAPAQPTFESVVSSYQRGDRNKNTKGSSYLAGRKLAKLYTDESALKIRQMDEQSRIAQFDLDGGERTFTIFEVLTEEGWEVAIAFEIFSTGCIRHQYDADGHHNSMKMDLPRESILELSEQDLSSKWQIYRDRYFAQLVSLKG